MVILKEILLKIPFDVADVQLAELRSRAPMGENWIYELKYDGYRMLIFKEGKEVKFLTRNHQDYTDKFPGISSEISKMDKDSFVLDGEIVIFKDGYTDFSALTEYIKTQKGNPTFVAFDLLALDGRDIRNESLYARKEKLSELLSKKDVKRIAISGFLKGDGNDIFKRICALKNHEGIVAKRIDKPYIAGRGGDWIKVKCDNRQEFVILGYSVSEERGKGISSLLVGVFENNKFRYMGRVGTGYTEKGRIELEDKLSKDEIKKPSFNFSDYRSKEKIVFIKTGYIAEVKYASITQDGMIRQGSYKGLREDKSPKEVSLEFDLNDSKTSKYKGKESALKDLSISEETKKVMEKIRFTNPDKEIAKGVTKKDILNYYIKISSLIKPYIINRLLTLIRCPSGIDGECFYQKHLDNSIEGMEKVHFNEEGKTESQYFYIKNIEGLYSAVQLGTLEFHGWNVKKDKIDKPDMIIFDLDPDEGMGIDKVREGVLNLKKILDELDLKSFLKISGGKGYHIVVPLDRKASYEKVKEFSKNVALAMEIRWKEKYTSNMKKEKRKGKIYVDWVRNSLTQTSVLPYSLRKREGITVSMPISYDDLYDISPSEINIFNVDKYIEKNIKKDPWKDFFNIKQSIK